MSIAVMFERVMNRALLGLGLLWASAACATNVFVVPEGTHAVQPEWVYTNWATAATNIQEAHDAIDINDGNIIFITNGLYRLTNQLMITKGVVLRSWKDGATAPAETILDANNDGKTVSNRVMVVSNAVAILDGLTIQNGSVANDYGAGITIYKCLLVTNCIIQNNISMGTGYGGGGIQVWTPWLGKITHCLVSSNYAGRGGGLFVNKGSTGIIEHCTIISNYASHNNNPYGGGGLNMAGSSDAPFPTTAVTARWCTIAFNTAYACGGGVNIYFNGGVVENCLIASNYQVRTTGSIRRGSGVHFNYGTGQGIIRNCLIACNSNVNNNAAVQMYYGGRLENCTVVNNRNGGLSGIWTLGGGTGCVVNTIIYSNLAFDVLYTNEVEFTNCCAPDELLGADNITGYPAFADPAGDFRLTSDSPCINKGLNLEGMDGARDLLGKRRILERVVDIGAYEFLRRGMVVIGR
ncbi:MAG: choice-of-anchor Q domain-containing protein [Kiritimatiellae bacterium]|nr:choice-of-anchor Q domain-containing protein [Kiritimatiellia bacterium]